MLRTSQVTEYEPMEISQHVWPPFTDIKDSLFNYLDCVPNEADNGKICDGKFTRGDLALMLHKMYPNMEWDQGVYVDDLTSYQTFVSKEWHLRDYNGDGFVTRAEFDEYEAFYR